MRLLIVTHNYPRFPGDPAGAFVARLARSSAAEGLTVRVVAPRAPGYPVDAPDSVGVERFRYAPRFFERVGYQGGPSALGLLSPRLLVALPLFLARFRRVVRDTVRTFSPNVIHAHWWIPGGWAAVGHGPLVITCHGTDVRLLAAHPWLRGVARRVLRRAGQVTVVSRFLSGDLQFHVPGLRPVAVTPMPVDTTHFSRGCSVPRAVPPRVLFAGNLVDSKGVDILLRAYAQLVADGVDSDLRILGEGVKERDLRGLAVSLGIARRVTWSTFRPQSEMPAEYGAATVTVLPSRGNQEGLGLTLVEALLAGCAVVGTPAGGIRDVVEHERTGLLARDGDPSDLALQIRRLLTDEGLRRRLADAGRNRMLETHDPERCVRRFIAIYHDLAAD